MVSTGPPGTTAEPNVAPRIITMTKRPMRPVHARREHRVHRCDLRDCLCDPRWLSACMLAYSPTGHREAAQKAAAIQLEVSPLRRANGGLGMHRCRKRPMWRHPGLRYASVLCTVALLNVLPACVTTNTVPEMVWVRTDGRRIADDPALLQQGKSDMALCHADLDAGSANETARNCMAQRGYALVQKDQAEEVRAAYATAAQRTNPSNR
jgi:hypothetical protein